MSELIMKYYTNIENMVHGIYRALLLVLCQSLKFYTGVVRNHHVNGDLFLLYRIIICGTIYTIEVQDICTFNTTNLLQKAN